MFSTDTTIVGLLFSPRVCSICYCEPADVKLADTEPMDTEDQLMFQI